jgi:hypothetical protein
MVTLIESWNSGYCTFPEGTVFIPQKVTKRGTIYAYGTPDGGHGQVIIDVGITPGE